MVSESPGPNEREPSGGLEKKNPEAERFRLWRGRDEVSQTNRCRRSLRRAGPERANPARSYRCWLETGLSESRTYESEDNDRIAQVQQFQSGPNFRQSQLILRGKIQEIRKIADELMVTVNYGSAARKTRADNRRVIDQHGHSSHTTVFFASQIG